MTAVLRVLYKLRQLAPYALIELILPGGTLLALGLWLYRKGSQSCARKAPSLG